MCLVVLVEPEDRRPRDAHVGGAWLLAPGVWQEHLLLTDRLLVHVHAFRGSTVLTPEGLIGRHEWRRLSKLMRNLDSSRICVLDLLHVVDVPDSVLLTLLAARRQRRYRGIPFMLWNLPVLTGVKARTL